MSPLVQGAVIREQLASRAVSRMDESSETPCLVWLRSESPVGLGDVVDAVESQASQQEGPHRGHDAWCGSASDLGSVLVIGDVSDAMVAVLVAVLNVPVSSTEAKQRRRSSVWGDPDAGSRLVRPTSVWRSVCPSASFPSGGDRLAWRWASHGLGRCSRQSLGLR